uniref:Farnesyl-diphosphate farnesyltransferase n=1 Tax=Sphaerodactylus townsendi TaxID=933632 RepID=A0ACB8G9C6_9SAUR
MASCSSKAAASLFKRTLALSPPPRAAGGGCGRCGASGSPCATSLGGGRLRSAGSRLLQPPLPPSSPPRFLAAQPHSPPLLFLQNSLSDGLRTCFRYLNQTSRSFAAVIQALDGELRNAVCIFYLVLRALDTVEDDMTISLEMKVPMLQNFHSYLYQPDWKFMESKEKDRQVLEDFPTRRSIRMSLPASAIQDWASFGMAEFLEKKVDSKQDWDRYCHYVAGLVGIGLSQLFSASTLEDPIVGQDTELANSMGLFLQKTNIIRDYLEDQLEDREFWPREISLEFRNLAKVYQDIIAEVLLARWAMWMVGVSGKESGFQAGLG